MSRLVTKFKYINQAGSSSAGNYAKYIATRTGVVKVDDSRKDEPATKGQQKFVEQLLRDFPDSKDSLEYDDYVRNETAGNAAEFIARTLEENVHAVMDQKTYADYIATRPRAVRLGSHGLFTDEGKEVHLGDVSKELNSYEGNIWTVIISLRREDAEKLRYDSAERWRDMLRNQTVALSENFHIPLVNLRWYAAFHDESHHPHVHLMVYSKNEGQGHLDKKGVMNLRSSFAKDIFADEMYFVYRKETEYRDEVREVTKEMIAQTVEGIKRGVYNNPQMEHMLVALAKRLQNISGKKVYGYLKSDVKNMVDAIADELCKDPRIESLYNLWYEQREQVLQMYMQEIPVRKPISSLKEFKPIKNAIIQEALKLNEKDLPAVDALPDEEEPSFARVPEPTDTDAEASLPVVTDPELEHEKRSAEYGNHWSQYRLAKMLLDRESDRYDPGEAIQWLMAAAYKHHPAAKYMLGKLFLRGEHIGKNVDYALRWLEEAAKEENSYARYLLGKTYLLGEDVEQDTEYARSLLIASAKQGNQYAAYALGKAYLSGDPWEKNTGLAMDYLKLSADRGFVTARYIYGKLLYTGEYSEKDIATALDYLESVADKNSYAAYLAGKIRMKEEGFINTRRAIALFELAAKENSFALYQLGRIYLYGLGVDQDYHKAMEYLHEAVDKGNQYAEQLVHSVEEGRNQMLAMSAIRLFRYLSMLFRNDLESDKNKGGGTDRMARRKTNEKKQAQGIRM